MRVTSSSKGGVRSHRTRCRFPSRCPMPRAMCSMMSRSATEIGVVALFRGFIACASPHTLSYTLLGDDNSWASSGLGFPGRIPIHSLGGTRRSSPRRCETRFLASRVPSRSPLPPKYRLLFLQLRLRCGGESRWGCNIATGGRRRVSTLQCFFPPVPKLPKKP